MDMSDESQRRAFRDVLGHWATGVTVVTALDARGGDVGITVNSFTSVSIDPPLVLWCLGNQSATFDTFSRCSHFAVNVLSAAQRELALLFADRSVDKFASLRVERGAGGVALLPGCIARLQCVQRNMLAGGDHVILVGEVVAMEASAGDALLFHRGRFVSSREVTPGGLR